MRVIALNKFEYANKLRQPGDEFETTSDKDADILIIAQQVKRATIETRTMKAEEPTQNPAPMTTTNGEAITRPKKNTYKRRDLRAE